MATKKQSVTKKTSATAAPTVLLDDLRHLIEETRQGVAVAVNAALTLLYWRIGKRINEEILNGQRADYGKQIVATVSQELTRDYGKGFSYSALTRMIKFNEAFPQTTIVATLSQHLSWSHFCEILPLDNPLQRDFYADMCRIERWSVRMLRQKIDSMLYERTALSRKPEKLIEQELATLREEDTLTPDLVFRDPYFLEFLGLKDTYAEKDLEAAILREMEAFILELGVGFAFLERQKRITLDSDDFYLDLLFFHRRLQRLVAVELKLGAFKPAYKGQMELYLRWLDKYERQEGEGPPVGIILCAGKKQEQIELLELGKSGIHVAEYLTHSLPKEVMQKKFHKAVTLARKRLENTDEERSNRAKVKLLDDNASRKAAKTPRKKS